MGNRFLTRRGLFATSGAALAASGPLVLAACGETADDEEETSPAREAELLNLVLAQQLAVIDALAPASGSAPAEIAPSLDRLSDLRRQSSAALERAITDLDGTPGTEPGDSAGAAESPTEGVARQLEASIAVSLEAIGELTPERRKPVHRAITEDAASLAAIRATLGEKIAPDAFVMGPPAARAAA